MTTQSEPQTELEKSIDAAKAVKGADCGIYQVGSNSFVTSCCKVAGVLVATYRDGVLIHSRFPLNDMARNV